MDLLLGALASLLSKLSCLPWMGDPCAEGDLEGQWVSWLWREEASAFFVLICSDLTSWPWGCPGSCWPAHPLSYSRGAPLARVWWWGWGRGSGAVGGGGAGSLECR